MMQIKWVYKFFPVIVIYTDSKFLIPEPYAGCSWSFFVSMKKSYEFDVPMLYHEITHAKQWYKTLGMSSVLYRFYKKYRYRYEVEAYAVQASFYGAIEAHEKTEKFAEFISTRYKLNVTREAAESSIWNWLNKIKDFRKDVV